jgi:hypothetical protein
MDGIRLGNELRKKYEIIDLHGIPILRTRVREIVTL